MSSFASESLNIKTPAISNPPPLPETKTLENQTGTQVSNPSINNKTLEVKNPEISDQSIVPRSEGGNDEKGDSKTLEEENPEVPDQLRVSRSEEGKDEEGEEEEEGECGFCLFMKAGGCRESFIAWEKCVEDAEKNNEDIVEKCFEVTGFLKKCMDAHADYYEPILQAEKAAEQEAMKELELEAASVDNPTEKTVEEEAIKELEREASSKDKQES